MKALTSHGRGYQPWPLDSLTGRAMQAAEQRSGSWDRVILAFQALEGPCVSQGRWPLETMYVAGTVAT